MDQYTQSSRLISIESPLGADKLLLTAIEGNEHISDLFEFNLAALSNDLAIKPDSLIGKEVTITIKGKTKKVFHGFINRFTIGEVRSHNLREYKMTMVPWLWFLSRTEGRRIFQNKKSSEIIKLVFEDLGFKDFEFKLQGTQPVREYCVQYGESDLNFVSRLMEEDGLAYYFKHTDKKHTLVLVDQKGAYEKCTDQGITYSRGTTPDNEINRWIHAYEFRTGVWTLNDYNFKEPNKSQLAESLTKSKFTNNNNFKHYDYPGVYDFPSGRDLAKMRMEAEEVAINTINGSSTCISFFAGGLFKVDKHESKDERGDYLLTSVLHSAQDGSYFAGENGSSYYKNDFTCIPADVSYRPALRHQKPVMRGPQSAVVTGPAGEEIYIDEYGRIKVQFIWDREGKKDENSSCYLRVMQSWAGNQWGASFIPRIGHEVIVTFLDGDPDRPIVTGTVYNGANKPVYSSKTQSGIKTRSTKGGSAANANEFRFEDLKGSEQIFIHAEKNLDTEVENDETHSVDHDRTKTIKHDEISNIGNDRNKTVGNNQSEDIGKSKTITVGTDHNESIGKNMTITIGADLKESVDGQYLENVTKDYSLQAKSITMQAQDKITLQTGSAKIVMSSNGDITISGANINVKGSGNVVIKGSKVLTN
jgi:type VI secretion system secreted protein VgrG